MAGAWLGILLGPIGVALAWNLKPKQPDKITIRPTSNDIKIRLKQKAKTKPRTETEMERFERLYEEGQKAAKQRDANLH